MTEIIVTIKTSTPTDDPEQTVWEQSLLEHVLQDALETSGYGDATISIDLEPGELTEEQSKDIDDILNGRKPSGIKKSL